TGADRYERVADQTLPDCGTVHGAVPVRGVQRAESSELQPAEQERERAGGRDDHGYAIAAPVPIGTAGAILDSKSASQTIYWLGVAGTEPGCPRGRTYGGVPTTMTASTTYLDRIGSMLAEKGYEVTPAGSQTLKIREVTSGVGVQAVLEGDI